jgi:hypothetical protein
MTELKTLWSRTLGEIPNDQQFELWSALHAPEVIRHGVLKTAQKNLSMGGTMSSDHKIRFAAKVMLTATAAHKEHAANRETLRQEFESRTEVA